MRWPDLIEDWQTMNYCIVLFGSPSESNWRPADRLRCPRLRPLSPSRCTNHPGPERASTRIVSEVLSRLNIARASSRPEWMKARVTTAAKMPVVRALAERRVSFGGRRLGWAASRLRLRPPMAPAQYRPSRQHQGPEQLQEMLRQVRCSGLRPPGRGRRSGIGWPALGHGGAPYWRARIWRICSFRSSTWVPLTSTRARLMRPA